ncbi:MAG: hypothetical protein ABI700_10500, partial [Chloroflexota bacterium]
MLKRFLKRLGAHLGQRQRPDSLFVPIKDKTGKVVGMMDKMGAEFFSSPKPALTQSVVDQLFNELTLVRMVHNVVGEDRRFHPETILNVTDPEALSSLRQALRLIEDETPFHVWSVGDYRLEFYQAEKLFSSIEILSANSVRLDLLHGDAHLRDGLLLFNWLSDRGVKEPLTRYYDDKKQEEKSRHAEDRWKQATPACLLPFWKGMTEEFLEAAILQTTLEAAYPNPEHRALELFRWFGSGEGHWSGYPVYESYPEQLLLNFPTDQLVTILMAATLTESQLEGASRYFAGWRFYKKRGAELALIPWVLKQQFLKHSLTSPDEDKRNR